MMGKLTKDILLQKGLPKSSHLRDLKTLNLSNMQLETKDIDCQLFSQMLNLEELNISGNCLSEIPAKLRLPNLKVLNFTDNQVEEVTILKQFPNIEELLYEENLYLTVSDNYKVYCLLPKLRRLNKKDITSVANHIRFVNHRELSLRVDHYWEKNYKDKLPDEPSAAAVKSVSKEFLKSVGNQVKYGPNSLKDFTKWKVQIIAENLISSLLDDNKKNSEFQFEQVPTSNDAADNAPETPTKRMRSNKPDCEVRTPSKRLRTGDVLSSVLSPRRSSKIQDMQLRGTPIKNKEDKTPVKESSQHERTTPAKVNLQITPSKKPDPTSSIGKQKDVRKKKEFDLEPLHFLQSHSKNNNSDDLNTQLWSCAFEPNPDSFSCKVIATCGGESVCVIDCDTGKVLKKYKTPGEEFFTLAWTTLTMICNEGQKKKINILAAGGRQGTVRLMHPKVSLCYGEIKAHKKAISIMCFSPTQDTFLFTGSYDKRIILWDIGVPDYEYNFRSSQLLVLDTTSTPLRLCPVPASPEQYLLAACEDGCFVFDIKLIKKQGRRSHEVAFSFPIYSKEESRHTDFHIIDSLAFLTDDLIVSKSAMQGSIYIWSWKKSFETRRAKSSKKTEAAVLAELRWSDTDLPYLTLATSSEGCCVFCGDEAGSIWIYDLESCKAKLQKGVSCSDLQEPTKIVTWPYPVSGKEKVKECVINTVVVDPALEYLVALTDKNIISIWKMI